MHRCSKILLLFIFIFYSCDSNNYLEIDGYTMGTTYSIKILASSIDKNKIKDNVEAILDSINMDMSTYIDSSSISKFNNSLDMTAEFKTIKAKIKKPRKIISNARL